MDPPTDATKGGRSVRQAVPVTHAAAHAPQSQSQPQQSQQYSTPVSAGKNLFKRLMKDTADMFKDAARDAYHAPAAWVGQDKMSRLGREQERKEREQRAAAATRAPAAAVVAQPVSAVPTATVATAAPTATPAAHAPTLPGAPLPEGWGWAYDPSGRVYFLNHKERTTTYDDPRGKY